MAVDDLGRVHDLGSDDSVVDHIFRWYGPIGAERWWPESAQRWDHLKVYLKAMVPALVVAAVYAVITTRDPWTGAGIFAVLVISAWNITTLHLVDRVDVLRPTPYWREAAALERSAPRPTAPTGTVVHHTTIPLRIVTENQNQETS